MLRAVTTAKMISTTIISARVYAERLRSMQPSTSESQDLRYVITDSATNIPSRETSRRAIGHNGNRRRRVEIHDSATAVDYESLNSHRANQPTDYQTGMSSTQVFAIGT